MGVRELLAHIYMSNMPVCAVLSCRWLGLKKFSLRWGFLQGPRQSAQANCMRGLWHDGCLGLSISYCSYVWHVA